jgi:eukaryotic-like serine/threonine-protein kinase
MVDLMSRDLDGAGTIHTIPPAVVVQGWKGKSDRENAKAAATRLRADYAVYGTIIASTGETASLQATLLHVGTDAQDSIIAEFKGSGAEIPRLADSLAMVVISELSRRHRLGAVDRPAPQGTSSVTALRYFLQGEQLFRQTNWDSALVAFRRSSDADSSFALPLHRRSQIMGWISYVSDSEPKSLALRAGRLNRGLAPRDSLIVAADSLNAAATTATGVVNWSVVPKLFALLDRAIRTYPDDPEAWYLLGEARYHLGFGRPLGVTDSMVLDAFDRSIELDSAFGPAYVHAPEIALQVRGTDAARQYAELYLRREPGGQDAKALRLVAALFDPKSASNAATTKGIDTLPWDDLHRAFLYMRRWPDSASSAMRILSAADRRPRNATPYAPDTTALRWYIPLELAFRGRMNEAFTRTRSSPTVLLTELAFLNAIPRDTATALFESWLSTGHPAVRSALPWWAQMGDTASIVAFARRADSTARSATVSGNARTRANYTAAASAAYLALARRDSVTALAKFAALSDTSCVSCYVDRLIEARLHRARGHLAMADTLLSQRMATVLSPMEVLIALERGEVAASLGKAPEARRQFQFVIDAWGAGDASLAPFVRRARDGLSNLNGRAVASVTARPNVQQ